MNHAEAVDVSPGSYDKLIERMLEQLNMGYCFEELIDSVYDQLHGIVPYNRIAVALLEEETNLLRLTSCRSDGKIALKVGYAARLEGSTLSTLLQTGQLRIIDDLEEYLASKGLIKLAACGVKCLEANPTGAGRHASRAAKLLNTAVAPDWFELNIRAACEIAVHAAEEPPVLKRASDGKPQTLQGFHLLTVQ